MSGPCALALTIWPRGALLKEGALRPKRDKGKSAVLALHCYLILINSTIIKAVYVFTTATSTYRTALPALACAVEGGRH